MNLVFSDQPLPAHQVKSIFLAGPSPRRAEVADWRPKALEALRVLNFDGTVFIPIPEHRFQQAGQSLEDLAAGFSNASDWTPENQVAWECQARAMADLVVFWVPRVIDRSQKDLGMPAFTTNFEMAKDLDSGKVLYGRPSTAVKCSYLDQVAVAAGLTVHEDISALLSEAVTLLGAGAAREGGEAQVPLRIWNTPAFQSWYSSQRAAGNRLDGAELLSQVTVGRNFLFCFLLKVKVWVECEQRHKSNEFFVSRPDISAVIAAYQDKRADGTPVVQVALVREFRSTVNNAQALVYEPPAGSTSKPGVPADVNAQQELSEETGLLVEDVHRFKHVNTRQLAATFSTHRANVYAVELTEAEFRQLQATAAAGLPLGEESGPANPSGERTYVEVACLADVFKLPVDYSTLGMVVEGLKVLGLLELEGCD